MIPDTSMQSREWEMYQRYGSPYDVFISVRSFLSLVLLIEKERKGQ